MGSLTWSGLDWDAVGWMLRNPSSSRDTLVPLLQASLDAAGVPAAELCASAVASACLAGVFALRVSVVNSLLQQNRFDRKEVVELIEPAAAAFTAAFGPELVSKKTLNDEFGEDRSEPPTLPQLGLHMLGRLLYELAGLPPPEDASASVGDGVQFAFGANWRQFIERGRVTAEGLVSAVREARHAVGGALSSLRGLRVLDLGCGSGLQSLALRLLGARVDSVDAQPAALEATRQLQAAFAGVEAAMGLGSADWTVSKLSALDAQALARHEPVDIVYTWGVLHHTGDLWQALHNAQLPLAEDGLLLVALYAEEYYDEKENLLHMKRFYRNATAWRKEQLEIAIGIHWIRPLLKAGRGPFEVLREFASQRGMDFWTDVRDWLGGWPMEFASTMDVLAFARRSGLRCVGVRRYGGNTEFQLVRPAGVARWTAGRTCHKLEEWREDTTGEFGQLLRRFYHHEDEESPRRWWRAQLPKPLRAASDGTAEPQRDRLMLLKADGEPFGYPTAQFARPDSLADPALQFNAFWEGTAFASPASGARPPEQALQGLQACLLPEAELDPEALRSLRNRAAEGLARLGAEASAGG